jgi:hypothetical protein
MEQCARQAADGAGEAEPEEDPPVNTSAQHPETERRTDHVGNRNGSDGQTRSGLRREDGREQAADAEARDRGDRSGSEGGG